MKWSGLLIIFSLCFSSVFAQEKAETIYLIPKFEKGQVYNYKITKSKKAEKDGVLTKDESKSYLAKLEVLEKNTEYYKLKWSYDFDFSQFNLPENISKEIKEKMIADVEYKTSLDGSILEILNWEELSKKLSNMIDFSADLSVKNNSGVKNEIDNFKSYMKNLLSVKENIEAFSTSDLQLIHNPLGSELTVGESFEYEEERANPFGGNNIKANNLVNFKKSSNQDNYILLIESKIDQEDSKSFVKNIANQMKLQDEKFEDFLKNSSFDINDFTEFEYSTKSGVTVRAETKRDIKLKMKEESVIGNEITRIELVSK